MKRTILAVLMAAAAAFSQAQPIKVACVGNSITYGAGIPNRFQNAYPGILQQMLGEKYDVRNFGVSGTTTLFKGNFPYTTTNQYKQALEFLPDIVTVKLGTNDSKLFNWNKYGSGLKKDLTAIVKSFQNLESHPKVYLCIPVPCFHYSSPEINDSVIVSGVIPVIRKVAAETGAILVDLRTPLESHKELFPDGIHPNAEGSAVAAAELYKAITGSETAPSYSTVQPFPGTVSEWNGGTKYDFIFKGRNATVVKPKKALPGNPWIWRPAFFGAFPSVDIDLLGKGFHVAYYDLTHFYGNPWSVAAGTDFYNLMHDVYGLSGKVVVEGFSRGGYFAFNWAAANPEKVACLYVDAPVCSIRSWPGKEKLPQLWNDAMKCWNITEDQVDDSFRGDALNLLEPLAAAHIPIMAVCGGKDEAVPYNENMEPVRRAYEKLGGTVELILKPECGHHPHSLDNPEPVSDFIMRYREGYQSLQRIQQRGGIGNALSCFVNRKKGCVAFLGGSITEMKGWKDMVEEDLRQRFPECEFTFIEAGISSMGSTPHAFRLKEDVLDKGTPDLMFVEAAVNDDTNGFNAEKQVRAMEGIVRHTLAVNPSADIVMLHFIYDPFIPLHREGIRPDVVMNHERVANRYRLPSIDMVDEIGTRMEKGELTWEEFGGTHPAWYGSKYYAAAVSRLIDMNMASVPANATAHNLPAPIDTCCYSGGDLVSPMSAHDLKGFSMKQDWTPEDPAVSTRKQYVHVPMLEAVKPGSSLTLDFEGTAIGIYGTFGPNASVIEFSVDGAPYRTLDTYTLWSANLYIPWLYVLQDGLPSGKHTLKLRTAKDSRGGCLIYRFAVNTAK